jgi:hypothetical protein
MAASVAAYEEAWEEGMSFECPAGADSECPELQLIIRVETRPSDDGCIQGTFPIQGWVGNGFECSASCRWQLRIRCVKGKTELAPGQFTDDVERQELNCDDDPDEAAEARGRVSALALGLSEVEAKAEAMRQLLARARAELVAQSLKISCAPECPQKETRFVLGVPTIRCLPPIEGGGWSCSAACRWYALIRCRS